jgi:xyloglucan-specific exo-beta-1,4-glucanase
MAKNWLTASRPSLVRALATTHIAALALLWHPGAADAQSYTWSNVEIVGGGFVPGIVFNPTERGLV